MTERKTTEQTIAEHLAEIAKRSREQDDLITTTTTLNS